MVVASEIYMKQESRSEQAKKRKREDVVMLIWATSMFEFRDLSWQCPRLTSRAGCLQTPLKISILPSPPPPNISPSPPQLTQRTATCMSTGQRCTEKCVTASAWTSTYSRAPTMTLTTSNAYGPPPKTAQAPVQCRRTRAHLRLLLPLTRNPRRPLRHR